MSSPIPETPSTIAEPSSLLRIESESILGGDAEWKHAELDLSELRSIHVLHTHTTTLELHDLEDKLLECNAPLTYDPSETRIFLTKIRSKRRVELELRSRGVYIESAEIAHDEPPKKRTKLDSQATLSQLSVDQSEVDEGVESNQDDYAQVLRVDWLKDSLAAQRLEAFEPYQILAGRIGRAAEHDIVAGSSSLKPAPKHATQSILIRARDDAPTASGREHQCPYRGGHFHSRTKPTISQKRPAPPLSLTQSTTGSDDEAALPPAPDWVREKLIYACQRRHPRSPPNTEFIALLKRIKLARILTSDEIGVRAYSTAIASMCAYPHVMRRTAEVARLPGCDGKISALWQEWHDTGSLQAVQEFEKDEEMKVVRLFYDIWGVGSTTARQFYARGWRDLDDVVEYGWSTLTRAQQIGVKFYDEFLIPIPYEEVERITAVVLEHAKRVRDEGVEAIVVGGYRKRKPDVMDVDIILTHRKLDVTAGLVTDVLASLEESGYVTHTLVLSEHNTSRGQSTLPFRGNRGTSGPLGTGIGFDTLDKALVVWQDPHAAREEGERDERVVESADEKVIKNPHRRVDIIISPWRTVGCAVLGWSADTTFERDLRRYAKSKKHWKFDSSGIRSRENGAVIRAEGPEGVPDGLGWLDAEKRVFDALELDYIPPEERCTG
ncbi:Nucleotidyltransferase [Eremomyces bilateralis CBS 781.70]|uniref:DNA polymerase n=1 Tax=Eremomyces bilateralis CBS 781.70 TaxID=1392243 RepID=A0A6G1G3M5_9PEZI|nr:Nucleotidyltransferase [Eremomyces bilateralis CBS 781.70]KAF1812516.1 Nucleotidyltransferase [Eremomyces bilateralis CBS 781.70]